MLGKTNKRSFKLHWQDRGLSAADSKILVRITEFEKTDPTFIEAKNTPMGEAKRDFNNSIGLDSLWSGTAVSQAPTKLRISKLRKYVSLGKGFYYRKDIKNGGM